MKKFFNFFSIYRDLGDMAVNKLLDEFTMLKKIKKNSNPFLIVKN